MTRYVVVGAGAVGSALGGLLARHGVDVLLVARGDHARAMAEGGLTVRCPDTTLTVPVPVVTAPDQARLTLDDVLVLTTKTHQAEAAVNEWADVPVRADDGAVAGRAADLLPIFVALNGVAGEENVLQALLGDTTGAEDLLEAVEAEARVILAAAAVPIVGDEEARAGWEPEGLSFRPVPGEPTQLGGSTWQSLVRRTGTIETDYLNGEIALIARRLGRPAPINTRLTAIARRAARDGLTPGAIDADQLRALLSAPDGGPGDPGSRTTP